MVVGGESAYRLKCRDRHKVAPSNFGGEDHAGEIFEIDLMADAHAGRDGLEKLRNADWPHLRKA